MDTPTKLTNLHLRSRKQTRPATSSTAFAIDWKENGESTSDSHISHTWTQGLQPALNKRGRDLDDDIQRQALRTLVADLARVRQEERRKIANDLHDHAAQNLVLALMKLGILEGSLPKKKVSAIQEVRLLIKEVLDETRSLVSDLHPQALRDLEFESALDWLLQHTRARYGLACNAVLISAPQGLSKSAQETLLQGVRELLINVAKHAHAKHSSVIVKSENGRIVVHVVDDGEGFDPLSLGGPKGKGGFGLLSVRERVTSLGGDLRIDSNCGKGTTVTLTIPLESDENKNRGSSWGS